MLCSPLSAASIRPPLSSPPHLQLFPGSIRLRRPLGTTTIVAAGRGKKPQKKSGRIEGGGDIRREAKARARIRSRRRAENAFYRRNRQANSPDAEEFTEEELQMVGLGYDRWVRFFSGPDDPRLRHPHDWYRYGEFGPYSWRGIVVGPPIRGRFSDDGVSLIGQVKDQVEWEHIEKFNMSKQFSVRLEQLDASVGIRYFWVFARHPSWKSSEKPWAQWTLVAEVAVEAAAGERLDKWSLMGRFGNKTRAMITQCAAWERPDIIYVKKPIYQSRFEPQGEFFDALLPLLDPATENEYLFDLDDGGGRVVRTTYFGALCRIVKASPKAYVDDVVNAYSKLSEEGKSRCLEFLLTNHPKELLHPYTKEWKVKLEEMELGCEAPDESDDDIKPEDGEIRMTDWIEEDYSAAPETNDDDEDDDDDDDHEVIDIVNEDAEQEEAAAGAADPESEEHWDEQFKKAMKSSSEMEKFVKRSVLKNNKRYMSQMEEFGSKGPEMGGRGGGGMEEEEKEENWVEDWEPEPEQMEEWESAGYKFRKKTVKSKAPPAHFLRAAVRPFNYRNLVKEIVLLRHAIVDGDIGSELL